MATKSNPPIPLTNRLWQCRKKTTFRLLRAAKQAGFLTIEIQDVNTKRIWQWSGNPQMPDSRVAMQRLKDAVQASVTAGAQPAILTLVTRPDAKKAWEHFYWTFEGQGTPSKKDPERHGEIEAAPIEALWASGGE